MLLGMGTVSAVPLRFGKPAAFRVCVENSTLSTSMEPIRAQCDLKGIAFRGCYKPRRLCFDVEQTLRQPRSGGIHDPSA